MAALILGGLLAASGLWLLLLDRGDFDAARRERLQAIEGERSKVQAALAEVPGRMATITENIATERARIQQREGVITQLKALDNSWDKLTGDAQQQANSERRTKLEREQADAVAQVEALRKDYTRMEWERDGLEIELERLEARRKMTAGQTKVGHYLHRAWNYPAGWMKVKGWVGVLLCLYLLGLTVRGMALERRVGGPPRPSK